MITISTQAVTPQAVGLEEGIALEQAYAEYAPFFQERVQQLFATADEAGGWKRWLLLGDKPELADAIEAYAQKVRGRYTDMVVLGIGGSSLGGYALLKALLHPYWNQLADRGGLPRFHFVENVDSDQMVGLGDVLPLETTLFLVISKSGTTAETMSAFLYFKDAVEAKVGADKAAEHFVAITDANKGILRDMADAYGYPTFEVPDDVGGRFSVFSAVGLLPAALCGVDIRALQQGIRTMVAQCQNPDIHQNPAAQLALIHFLMAQRGKNVAVFMPYSVRLAFVSDWFVQLWAESLGKKHDRNGQVVHVGQTPVRAVGVTDQHSQVQLYNEGPFDKIITFVRVDNPDHAVTIPHPRNADALAYLGGKTFNQLLLAELESTQASLIRNRRPFVEIRLPQIDAEHFAQLLTLLEIQTALAGELLNIDPFDQPGVELAKQYTYALMGRKGFEHLAAEARGEGAAAV